MSVAEPSGSSASSFVVGSVSVTLPLAGIVTVRVSAVMPKSPSAATVTVTSSGDAGAGVAVSTKLTSAPSAPLAPPEMFTAGGGASSCVCTGTVPPMFSATVTSTAAVSPRYLASKLWAS